MGFPGYSGLAAVPEMRVALPLPAIGVAAEKAGAKPTSRRSAETVPKRVLFPMNAPRVERGSSTDAEIPPEPTLDR